ncbi:MAG: cold-shock DNA-binding domain protein [Promethearchaeota archaeon CR_4]|nr:MAG: cold-shock DNA-binding domain protein [Candidatus Lokiarchaeota archaeon CR_4]
MTNASDVGNHEVGTVKWFSAKKGYGFILRENGEEIFCHFSNVVSDGFKTLHYNRKVEFDIGAGRNDGSVEAKNVKELPAEGDKKETSAEEEPPIA